MTEERGQWVHLVLKDDVYADFEVSPVPVPVRLEEAERFAAGGGGLTPELMARNLVDYVEERPEEARKYAPLLAKMAYSVGTELARAGDARNAAWWLDKSAWADPNDPRILGNFARALARSGRPEKGLEVCVTARALPLDVRAVSFFDSVEQECRDAIDRREADPADPGVN